jgi:hypothetical protein
MPSASDRVFMGLVATGSIVAGLSYLFLFSLPHSAGIFNVPSWKVRGGEVGREGRK